MNKEIVKAVFGGLILGTAAFFVPFFLIKTVIIFFIIGAIFRWMFWRKFRYMGGMQPMMLMADKVRTMSDEEYQEFRNKMNDHAMNSCHGYRCEHPHSMSNK